MRNSSETINHEIKNDMKKKPQLYIKNEKGRYEPYKPDDADFGTCYRKVGKKYVPFATVYHEDWLNDGVFVVRADTRGKLMSMSDATYLQDCFLVEKVGRNYRITADQLASLQDYADFCYKELEKYKKERNESGWGISYFEQVQAVVGAVFKFSDILRKRMEEEKTQQRSVEDKIYHF